MKSPAPEKITLLGQQVLDAICDYEVEHGHYPVGGCFHGIEIARVGRQLAKKGIRPDQLGGIIAGLANRYYLPVGDEKRLSAAASG